MKKDKKSTVFIVIFDGIFAMPPVGSTLLMTRNPENFRYFRTRKDALEAMKLWHPGEGSKEIKEIELGGETG